MKPRFLFQKLRSLIPVLLDTANICRNLATPYRQRIAIYQKETVESKLERDGLLTKNKIIEWYWLWSWISGVS